MIAAIDLMDLTQCWRPAPLPTTCDSIRMEAALEPTRLPAPFAWTLDSEAIARLEMQISALAATADEFATSLPVLSSLQISRISSQMYRSICALQIEMENWLTYARVLAGSLQVQVQPTDPMDLVQDIAPVCDAVLAPRDQRLTVTSGMRCPLLAVDQHLVRQAIVNMVAEISILSKHYTPVNLALLAREGKIRITVQGYCHEPVGAALESVGDAGARSPSNTTPPTPHMHLARAITRAIVAAHGGCVRICSRRGSKIARWIELPFADPSTLPHLVSTSDREVRYESTAG
jgi:K+-sensing histidine kinase KdpD